MSMDFKIRKDFQSIEEEIYRLIEYGKIFHGIRNEYSELKHHKDFDKIYTLPIRQREYFEYLYSSGADSSFHIYNILENINNVEFFPTLSMLIKDLKKSLDYQIKLKETLLESEKEYINLNIDAIPEMQFLHKKQLEYLSYINTMIPLLKESDIFKKENNIMLFSNNNFDYDKLRDDLIEISLLETKNRNAISKESEDETNDRFRNALANRGYNITDQSRGGESSSGINAGERDLVVCNSQGIDESIIEAFILNSLDSTIINKHYEKLVKRYDTVGNSVNFILVYSKTKNFDDLWKKYIEYDRFESFVDTKKEYSQKDNVRVSNSNYTNQISPYPNKSTKKNFSTLKII